MDQGNVNDGFEFHWYPLVLLVCVAGGLIARELHRLTAFIVKFDFRSNFVS